MHAFSDKSAAETVTLTFDFSAELGAESISTSSVAIEALVGDSAADLSGMLNGPSSSTASSVLQSIKSGVSYAEYKVTATANTPTRTLQLAGKLRVRPAE